MEHFPVFLNVRGRPCLVVGAGEIAARKVESLRRAGAQVCVVAPEACEDVKQLAAGDGVRWEQRGYRATDLDTVRLVIAATDNRDLNSAISSDAQARGIPVNVVDDPDLCTFIVPSIVERGAVLVAISTGGASPTLAKVLRERIDGALPTGVDAFATMLRDAREQVHAIVTGGEQRRAFWDRVVRGDVGQLALAGRLDEARKALRELVTKAKG
jgi:uroporphyrin-III C-methyltransferase/precorrin-2 dehydrogenase/sirohydrochlorin ferrochelatase